MPQHPKSREIEWPTLAITAYCYGGYILTTIYANTLGLWLFIPVLAIIIAQHSSLQHEVLHGHPFANQHLNDLLVFPAIGLFVPYQRFRDLHLAHHYDPNLTDPYDDPESNFLDPDIWPKLPKIIQIIYGSNNTLFGRMALGPAISILHMLREDFCEILRGKLQIMHAYILHLAGVILVIWWYLSFATQPLWAYILASYIGMSLLKIRTYLEHRAGRSAPNRSVIIESNGPLALLFLNNNFHAVHHANPKLAWYRLPKYYAARKKEFLRRNGGYMYRSYGEIFAKYLFKAKDPVAHPLWPVIKRAPGE